MGLMSRQALFGKNADLIIWWSTLHNKMQKRVQLKTTRKINRVKLFFIPLKLEYYIQSQIRQLNDLFFNSGTLSYRKDLLFRRFQSWKNIEIMMT